MILIFPWMSFNAPCMLHAYAELNCREAVGNDSTEPTNQSRRLIASKPRFLFME
ncbi:MAG: hypothetical protein H7A24_11815 [Leptospiraceae bacterium]|nr:hypothetical protein [Leptospiraceae bacterium]MCP5512560.1 hypothetical protein [Leptospiraceae bacterium]